jgi:CO dehydrogenase maturation factor
VVLDLEASPEAMTRGTVEHVDHLLLVAEPYFKSMETARRYHELGTGLGIPRISVVANKVRDGEEAIMKEFCEAKGYELLTTIPYEPEFPAAERARVAPFDHARDTPGAHAIMALAELVMGNAHD